MPIKDILVCLDATDAGESRLRLAAAIAREHAAHLSAAYVLPQAIPGNSPQDALTVGLPTSEAWMPRAGIIAGVPGFGIGGDASRGLALAEIVEQRFRDAVQPHAIEGDWHMFGAGEATDLLALLTAVDLVIFGQAAPDYHIPTGFRPEDIIVVGGRPTLVVPYAGTFEEIGRRVLIAWDGTREATRAVHDTLPLIANAEAVTVMTVRDNEEDFERDVPSVSRIVRHLARHGITAQVEQTVRGDVPIADLLLSRAADLDADMIVAGAYHHTQIREALLGGVSRELLDHMTVPVLMSH